MTVVLSSPCLVHSGGKSFATHVSVLCYGVALILNSRAVALKKVR